MTLNGAAAENEKKIHDQMTAPLQETHDLGKQWLEWFHAKKGRLQHCNLICNPITAVATTADLIATTVSLPCDDAAHTHTVCSHHSC